MALPCLICVFAQWKLVVEEVLEVFHYSGFVWSNVLLHESWVLGRGFKRSITWEYVWIFALSDGSSLSR